MKERSIDPSHERCARCGYTRGVHVLANYADGQMVGAAGLICPLATWISPASVDAVDPADGIVTDCPRAAESLSTPTVAAEARAPEEK